MPGEPALSANPSRRPVGGPDHKPAPQAPADDLGPPLGGLRRKPTGRVPPPSPSRRSLRGLDWFVLFVANVQTGFGPFISVYLTTQKWTQVDIGLVLTVGSLAALVGQMPGGMVVDAARSERLLSGIALGLIAVSAVAFVAMPVFPVILAAAVLHSAASCVLGPAMAAISLGLVGHAAIGVRLGRNARFASIGNGLAAAAMGACGYFLSAEEIATLGRLVFRDGASTPNPPLLGRAATVVAEMAGIKVPSLSSQPCWPVRHCWRS